MNKKILFLILGAAIIILLIIISVTSKKSETSLQSQNGEVNPAASQVQTQEERDEIMREASLKGDLTICDQIQDQNAKVYCKDNVYYSLAVGVKDVKICDNIIDNVRKDYCLKIVGQTE